MCWPSMALIDVNHGSTVRAEGTRSGPSIGIWDYYCGIRLLPLGRTIRPSLEWCRLLIGAIWLIALLLARSHVSEALGYVDAGGRGEGEGIGFAGDAPVVDENS